MIRAGFTEEELRVAASNLLQAFVTRQSTPEYTQLHRLAESAFAVLCEVGAGVGLAETAEHLELIVADVVEQLPAPDTRGRFGEDSDWIWLMQARFLLARRLCGGHPEVEAA